MTTYERPRPGERYSAIAAAALAATFMQAVNISIPNAALPHMQGSLSMANDEVGWVFTSYITASVIVLPVTGWLTGRFGRKTVYLTSVAIFAVALVLNTLATTTLAFVAARFVQGLASAPLGPLSLAILLENAPPTRHARVTLIASVAILLGICTGPAIGGWLSEYYGWHSIFFASLPVAAVVFGIVALSPATAPGKRVPFDFVGLATISLGIVGLQMLLDRGERLEWFASPEIWIEAFASAVGFYLFIVHLLTGERPLRHRTLFTNSNFVLSTIIYFAFGFVLLPTLALTSPMLEELFGYPVDTTGLMTIPRGATLVAGLVAGSWLSVRIDTRLLIAAGMGLVIYANAQMLGYAPGMDWRPVVAAGLLQGTGLGIMMPALTKTALSSVDADSRPMGTMVFNLSRLYGSTIGIAIVQIFFFNNTQAMHVALASALTPSHTAAHGISSSSLEVLAEINEAITGQSAVIAIIGQFKILMIAMLVVSPLVLLLRRTPRPGAAPHR